LPDAFLLLILFFAADLIGDDALVSLIFRSNTGETTSSLPRAVEDVTIIN